VWEEKALRSHTNNRKLNILRAFQMVLLNSQHLAMQSHIHYDIMSDVLRLENFLGKYCVNK